MGITKAAAALALIEFANARGSRRGAAPVVSVRDAAHEAHHVLTVGAYSWDREEVHAALLDAMPETRRGPDRAWLWINELEARAVETLVCEALDVDAGGTLEARVGTSIFEAIRNGLPYDMDTARAVGTVRSIMASATGRGYADRVLALVVPLDENMRPRFEDDAGSPPTSPPDETPIRTRKRRRSAS